MSNSSICPLDRTLLSATTLGQSRPGSNGNEGVLCIPQSSRITKALPLDGLVSYIGHSSLYSTAPANWGNQFSGVFISI